MKRVINAVDGNNAIDKLHDDQLRLIISLLPTKDAFRTCVLSSRWKYLWLCISNVDLDEFRLSRNCINRLLGTPHGSSYIKRFCFSPDGVYLDRKRIHKWISKVIKLNVEELCIGSALGSYASFPLPLCLYKSDSLTVLEIDNEFILGSNYFFKVHLPSLKRLKLSKVVFLNHQSLHHLFSNIPKLQYLCLCRCVWKFFNRLVIDIPSLEGIDVTIRRGFTPPMSQVTLIAPNLTSFKCDTDLSIEFLVLNYSFSLDVNLKIYDLVERDKLPRLLESVKEAASLHVEGNLQGALWRSIATEDLPISLNLKELEISAYQYNSRHDFDFEKISLHMMPNLVSLTINVILINTQSWESFRQHFDNVWCKCCVPSCDSGTYLPAKRNFCHFIVIGLIKYFLNHSRILEMLEIKWFCHMSIQTQVVLDEIQRHPRYLELKRFSCDSDDILEP